ncbi:PIR Superfamily Protein [Plasmodium malariae]|uniref:PIR Superfamily Protein n=1 Tax=Plasmodium malariae TaxID=5858 RepID=A0A1A8X272_PLAMA|nr:PIR Superfamily Protein [Plasmodium malariae]
MEKTTYDEILQKLPSNDIYIKLISENNKLNNNFNYNIFDSVRTKYKGNYINRENVARNLKKIPEKNKLWNYNWRCLYYIYCVYEEISKFFENNSSNTDVTDVVTNIFNTQTSVIEDYRILNCSYNFDDEILKELYNRKSERYLYEYFAYYESIKSKHFCISGVIDKYKKYFNAIKSFYNGKRREYCEKNISKFPNYFLNCGNEFDLGKILSKFDFENKQGCNGLKSIIYKTTEDNPDFTPINEEFLKSIYLTACSTVSNGASSPNNDGMSCNLFGENVKQSFSTTAAGSAALQDIHGNVSSDVQVAISSTYLAEVLSEKNRKEVGDNNQGEKNKISFDEIKYNEFRWNFGSGAMYCLRNTRENDKNGKCVYLEELIDDGFFIKEKVYTGYKFTAGKKCDLQYLARAVNTKIEWKSLKSMSPIFKDSRNSQVVYPNKATNTDICNTYGQIFSRKDEEYNTLNNTFFRMSIVVVLVMGLIFVFFLYYKFTPFGSYVGKIRKRKKRD